MKSNNVKTVSIFCLLFLAGCSLVFGPDHTQDKPERYAELILGDEGRSQIIIGHDIWIGLITIEGTGGNRHVISCFADLQGDGPVYKDPIVDHGRTRGQIIVDRQLKKVTIDVQTIVSKPGDAEVTKPFPFNGTYPLTSITHGTFHQ